MQDVLYLPPSAEHLEGRLVDCRAGLRDLGLGFRVLRDLCFEGFASNGPQGLRI